jgi:hypothetical protein
MREAYDEGGSINERGIAELLESLIKELPEYATDGHNVIIGAGGWHRTEDGEGLNEHGCGPFTDTGLYLELNRTPQGRYPVFKVTVTEETR